MNKAGMALLGLGLLLPNVAGAQTINAQEGFYIGAGGGAAWFIGSNANASTSTGWAVGGKVGYDFVGPRVELEVGYGRIPLNAFIPGTALNGKVGQLNVMANVYTTSCRPRSSRRTSAPVPVSPSSTATPSLGSTQFAYQGMLGVALQRRQQLGVRHRGPLHRHDQSERQHADRQRDLPEPEDRWRWPVSPTSSVAPPAAPPPPPPMVAPPSFMVFFDWDRSNLSAQALNTIKQAAGAYKTKGNARITATGHTDTSGPEAYNMALSLRRANTVKDALVREGVPATAIAVVGRGEAGPAGADRRRCPRAAEPPRRDRHPVSWTTLNRERRPARAAFFFDQSLRRATAQGSRATVPG